MQNNPTRVLFICLSNAFRSRIAEAILNHRYGEAFHGESAGFRVADAVSPLAQKVMDEAGIPLEGEELKSVKELYGEGRNYDYVITICSSAEDEECPLFPGKAIRFNWTDFPNPEKFEGDDAAIHRQAAELRDAIDKRITEFVHVTGYTE